MTKADYLRIDADGSFWLPGREEEPVAGRVRYDSTDGGSLSLIGSFGGVGGLASAMDDASPRVVRIHGVAGRRLFTLDDCFQTHIGFEAPGRSGKSSASHASLQAPCSNRTSRLTSRASPSPSTASRSGSDEPALSSPSPPTRPRYMRYAWCSVPLRRKP